MVLLVASMGLFLWERLAPRPESTAATPTPATSAAPASTDAPAASDLAPSIAVLHSHDRTLDNIFVVQDEISAAIVDALKLELALGADETPTSRTESGEAYDLYLRGRELAREPSKDDLLRVD